MRETETPAEHAPSTLRWVSIALIASLCVNFLVLGLYVSLFWHRGPAPAGYGMTGTGPAAGMSPAAPGAMTPGAGYGMRGGHHGGRGGGHGQMGLGRGPLNPHMLMQAVPEKADAIGETLRAREDGMRDLREKAFAARTAAAQVLAGSGYTSAGFAGALKAVQKADMDLEAYVLATVQACVAQLTPEERRRAGEWQGSMGPGAGNGPGGMAPQGRFEAGKKTP